MSDRVKKLGILVVVFVVGVAVGRFTLPAKVVDKEHIVYKDRIVEKKSEVKDIQKKDHKIVIKIEHINTDGSKTIETKIMDVSDTHSKGSTSETKTDTKNVVDDKTHTEIANKDNQIISIMAGGTFSGQIAPVFGISYQQRVLWPFYLGGFMYSNNSAGLSLGLAL